MENLTPVLNLEHLQQKANEYALKGAEDAIKEFYNGYNSPYKKAIEENLKNKGVDNNFDIPDIVAVLNQKLSSEVDAIANAAIAKTFIPLVKEFLTREEANVKFSDILKKFIEHTDFNNDDFDISDYEVTKVEKESRSSSLNDTFPVYQITNGKDGFELHFYRDKDKLTVMSLPYTLTENKKYYGHSYERNEKMKLSLDGGATLELPFTRGILENNFVRFCARLIIGNSNIILDVENFEEEMFPEKECHC
jgi:hypothetical protein